ncbi:MAG: alpha/beta fold hydrolase [Promethearchaeota archaeon]
MQKKIIIDGISISYSSTGKGQPLLMLHGIGFGLHQFIYQNLELSNDHQVILFQVPLAPFNYSLNWLAQLLADFLDYLDIPKVIVLGSSFGGFLAQEFALNFPERVQKLFIVNSAPAGFCIPFKIRGMRFFLPFLPSKIFKWLYFQIQTGPMRSLLSTYLEAKFSLPTKQMLLQRLKAANTFNVIFQLSQLGTPTVIFYGTRDTIISPIFSKKLHKYISGSKLVSLDSGHVPSLEIPEIFNQKLRELL